MFRAALSAGIAAACLAMPALAEHSTETTAKVWQVDTSGRPPFKRTLVDMSVVDTASMEVDASNVETELVWTADFSGAPPFKRSLQEVPVIDAASLEADIEGEVSRAVKAKPFFKPRHQ